MASSAQGPDLDMEKGIAQFGGNEELYFSILGYYLEDMQPLLDQYKTIAHDDFEAYTHVAHSIKGASRNVFAGNLGDVAEGLEKAAREGDLAYINDHHEELLNDAQKLVQDITDMLKEKGL